MPNTTRVSSRADRGGLRNSLTCQVADWLTGRPGLTSRRGRVKYSCGRMYRPGPTTLVRQLAACRSSDWSRGPTPLTPAGHGHSDNLTWQVKQDRVRGGRFTAVTNPPHRPDRRARCGWSIFPMPGAICEPNYVDELHVDALAGRGVLGQYRAGTPGTGATVSEVSQQCLRAQALIATGAGGRRCCVTCSKA